MIFKLLLRDDEESQQWLRLHLLLRKTKVRINKFVKILLPTPQREVQDFVVSADIDGQVDMKLTYGINSLGT